MLNEPILSGERRAPAIIVTERMEKEYYQPVMEFGEKSSAKYPSV
jgi:hypothetical protein